MRSTPSPKAEKNRGNTPQLMPSLRLLTSPAWEQANRWRSLMEVLAKTSRKLSGALSEGCCSISSLTCSVVSREEDRDQQPEHRVADAEVEWLRPQAVYRGEVAGCQGGQSHSEIPGELVEAHGEAPPARPYEVYLHEHRHGLSEALIDPEEHVGRHAPSPRGGQRDHERHRYAHDPTRDEHLLPAHAICQSARYEVGARLDHHEGDDEREDRRLQHQTELLGADQGDHGPLEVHHPADEGVDNHQ